MSGIRANGQDSLSLKKADDDNGLRKKFQGFFVFRNSFVFFGGDHAAFGIFLRNNHFFFFFPLSLSLIIMPQCPVKRERERERESCSCDVVVVVLLLLCQENTHKTAADAMPPPPNNVSQF